ncbi:MAG: hypothetical protein HC913_15910 [Microscillaceae bacterium]|nr:hypothetical protein [Microscillaceae bacterium]
MVTILVILAIILTSFGGVYLYALESEKNALVRRKISNGEVVKIARNHRGRLTPRTLSEYTDLSESEASRKLHLMLYEGIFKYEYDENYLPVFTLSNVVQRALLDSPPDLQPLYLRSEVTRLSDSEVIGIALKANGRISATSLCLRGKVPIEEAQYILERLQARGVFDVEVTENGTVVYRLHDLDLLD